VTATATFDTTTPDGGKLYSYMANITPVSLNAGTTWISIVESDATTALSWRWEDASTTSSDVSAFRINDSGNWNLERGDERSNYAFTLFDTPLEGSTAPEPASLTMLGLGVFSIAGYTWRQRRRARARRDS
jgi:hypothetical protein